MQKKSPERTFTFRDAVKGLRRVISYVAEDRSKFIILSVAAFVTAFLEPISTYLFSKIIFGVTDPFLIHGVSAAIVFFVIWVIVSFLNISLNRISTMGGVFLDEKARIRFYIEVDDHVLRLPLSFHKTINSGVLWDKINTAGVAITDIMSKSVVPLFPQAISILVMLGISFYVNWIFGLIFLVGSVLYIMSMSRSVIPNARFQRKVSSTYFIARGHATDTMANIRAVKDFTAEDHERTKSIRFFEKDGLSIYHKYLVIVNKFQYSQSMISFGTRGVVLFLSLYFILKGHMNVAELVLFNAYVGSIFTPLRDFSRQWWVIQKGILAIQDVDEIIHKHEEIYVPKTPTIITQPLGGSIRFDHVSFVYESGQKILDDVSFEIAQGQVVALVGESGVGKSTTMDLISGYHFANEGTVSIGGIDVRDIPLRYLRSAIGVVPQETVLFNDTVKNNVSYGNFKASEEELFEAARKAHCSDFIQKFPQGWDTIVGERGLRLSVGQKQRISIARAILRNPKILILDEPTSALDAGTEKIITESLEELMQDRTTFIIAHRLSTVRRADLILVFKEGKIVERGTHAELLQNIQGEYRRLHDLQIGLHV
jgi:ABC-type multidrug transport system fused ATPase/permease subunit